LVLYVTFVFVTAIGFVQMPLFHFLQRMIEGNADCFAVGLNLPIAEALVNLFASLPREIPSNDAYAWFYLDHPQLPPRLVDCAKCPANK
jgi:hypothetical protein